MSVMSVAVSVNSSNSVITAEEAELYDRQIRLWGLDAQKLLRVSRLLVVGDLNYMATEACKNLVLAGIGSVTLCDTGRVESSDIMNNFVYSQKDVGTDRCDVMQQALHMLNPTVEVKVDKKELEEIDNNYIISHQYNIALMISSSEEMLKQVSKICHQLQVKFFAANCYGAFGYCFLDLGEHVYYDKDSTVAAGTSNGESCTEVSREVKHCVMYEDMDCFFSKVWKDPSAINMRRQPGLQAYFIIRAILFYLRCNKKLEEDSVDDVEKCVELVKEQCIRENVGNLKLSVEEDLKFSVGELCPAGAVLGATVAQEMIQVISQASKPHDNCILLDIRNLALHVLKI